MRAGMFTQPADIRFAFGIILLAADERLNVSIKSLDTNLKLQALWRELFQHCFQFFGQIIRHHFVMQIQIIAHPRQKEL